MAPTLIKSQPTSHPSFAAYLLRDSIKGLHIGHPCIALFDLRSAAQVANALRTSIDNTSNDTIELDLQCWANRFRSISWAYAPGTLTYFKFGQTVSTILASPASPMTLRPPLEQLTRWWLPSMLSPTLLTTSRRSS